MNPLCLSHPSLSFPTLYCSIGPAHTIASKPKPTYIEVLPGPADYQKVESAQTGPAFTIAARCVSMPGVLCVCLSIKVLPGPADYQKVEAAQTGPAFTIAAR